MRLFIEEALVELFLEGAYLLSKRLVVVTKKASHETKLGWHFTVLSGCEACRET